MPDVFQEEAICMQVWVDHAVHKAVRDVANHIQVAQEEVRSELFKAVVIAVPVFDEARKELASKVGVRLRGVCDLDEPMAETDLPASIVAMMGEKC